MRLYTLCLPVLAALIILGSCTRETIEFGSIPDNTYTELSYIDTVNVRLTTVLTDSFVTSGATTFLLGRYNDPMLGVVSAKPFFQLDRPASLPDIPSTAIFDSLVFILRTNKYYYGDTSRPLTITVNELNNSIEPTYSSYLFNTSDVAIKPVPLGSQKVLLRPYARDSVAIRLNDAKGVELYQKIKDKSTDLTSTENFKNYLKGISLSVENTDIAAVYGFQHATDSIVMRLYYHHTIPYRENYFVDFPAITGDLAFNQILANRTGSGLVQGTGSITAIPSSQTNGFSFSQPGTALNLKIGFPSLKGIQLTENYIKLLKAELILRPAALSFTDDIKLPDSLYLASTDGSNIAGSELRDSSGQYIMYASPVIDKLYSVNTQYRFNITSYINQLLSYSSVEDYGLFIMQPFSSASPHVTRLILQEANPNNYTSELRLTVLVVKK